MNSSRAKPSLVEALGEAFCIREREVAMRCWIGELKVIVEGGGAEKVNGGRAGREILGVVMKC
jgi:hypothetical protein